jgi:LemA protein
VTKARTAAQQAQGVQEQAQAENMLTQAIGRLFAVAEQYPQLRATENFQQLQAQLAETEQKIAVARQIYNDAALTYDNALETVPTNVVAGIFNFEPREYFEVEEPAAREAPRVQF